MTAEIKHGKEKGRHAQNALSDAFVRSAKGPEFYADGNGLYLKVDASGARRWVLGGAMVKGVHRQEAWRIVSRAF